MGHTVTLGGDRVGSGNKNKIYLHNYERSTHNLSESFTSSIGVGMLIPFMCKLATRDDKFEIDLNAGLRTIPTKGPMFGSFKLQLDVYQCPLRLYQALLHNNPLAIGLKANQVKFPKMRLYSKATGDNGGIYTARMAATNSLVRYLGISGIGSGIDNTDVYRDLFASGVLAYYDIFKNYYANKQEEYAYTLESTKEYAGSIDVTFTNFSGNSGYQPIEGIYLKNNNTISIPNQDKQGKITVVGNITNYKNVPKKEEFLNNSSVIIGFTKLDDSDFIEEEKTLQTAMDINIINWVIYDEKTGDFQINMNYRKTYNGTSYVLKNFQIEDVAEYKEALNLSSFKLSNIDDMRMRILSFHQLGQSFLLDGNDQIQLQRPYVNAIGNSTHNNWKSPLSGICVKTYQSDLFNNWINTEWIDGENGIAAITAISTSGGSITIDALNFSEKLYNLLNRIATSGATYEDYLDAAYTDSAKKFCEAPMWIGGMSDEIVFEEIVQTAPADGDPLGSLGGRGNLTGKKHGGKITCKVDEPSLIIGIVSITPRIKYTQGNDFFNTEIDSLQDIHVPALDGIAFQNLLAERLHAGSTLVNNDGTIEERQIVGKVPAWIEYMTSYDRAFGDFAETDGKGYMILNRDYLVEDGVLQDATTYIDPAKYNYAFAYTERDAQNFWLQIYSDIKARRLMSAKQIPTV